MAKKSKKNNGSSYVIDAEAPVEAELSQEEIIEPEGLENPLRIITLIDKCDDIPEGDMQERMLDHVQSMEQVDGFFDEFDEKICIPNEGHIKYEVGSDGLVLIVIDDKKLRDEVLDFVDNYKK